MISEQRGVTMSGFLLWALLLIAALLVGFRIGPAYYEYFVIQKQMQAIADDPALVGASRNEIEAAFQRRATVENIESIQARDLDIAKQGDRVVLSASYSTRVHLFGNVSACLDFNPTSAK